MEPDVVIGETLLSLNFRVQNAKLHGQEVSIFNKLSNRAQMACKSWNLKVACRHAINLFLSILKKKFCDQRTPS
jgi:hypothetical protein